MSTAASSTSLHAQDAIAELASVWRQYEADPDGAIRAITETAARALKVARASVWLISADASQLVCSDLYEAATNTHSKGIVLDRTTFPKYFDAMLEEVTIAAHDAHTDPSTSEFSASYLTPLGIGALLDAPIRTGLRLVGVLCHEHIGPARVWSPSEQKDAAFLASLASLTLELQARGAREALLEATLESTAEGILASDDTRILAFNQRFVEMWKIDLDSLRTVESVRRHIGTKTMLSGLISDANEAFAGAAGEAVDTMELDDGRVFERSSRPQVMAGRVIGRVWSFRDITAQRRAEGLLRASEAKMRDLAIRDGLTGLFNRRYALEQLTESIERSIDTAERLSIALVDLDYFKMINDQFGHLVGDAVLRDFSRQITQHVRNTDLVGRYGGEEFLVILRGANAAAGRTVMDKVREVYRNREFGDIPRYAFSAGVSELGVDGSDPVTLLETADKRLYEAKRLGRDRTC
ncbi:MAG: diguanylate cyclase [Deltaproteobacteria bacterium]|nr:diguanylate cyclase [Deltaproteobacteria bacterium]